MIDGVVITIDGPAGTGKSSVASMLAARLGLDMLDTGAMYRALTLQALSHGVSTQDPEAVDRVTHDCVVDFDFAVNPPRVLLDGRDVSTAIRSQTVTEHVSHVAAHRAVRERLVLAQRRIATAHPWLVTDGRDQGSVVFPQAPVRIYLDARPDVRARRRCEQLAASGERVDESAILAAIVRRDALDAGRATGPLRCPEGAKVVDTSDITQDQVVERLESIVRAMVGHTLQQRHAQGAAPCA